MNQRGATAAITALAMLALIGCAGLAVDTARAWLVEDRLKTAIDAASLVAARQISDQNYVAEATAVFWAEFTQGGGSHNYLGATVSDLQITPDATDSSKVHVSANASIPTTLFGVISAQTVAFSDFAVAQRAGTGLEVALVLDNTGSMATNNAIGSLITASQQLLGILYGSADTQPNLWVSVVPFAATLNIGNTHTAWLVNGNANTALSKYTPSQWMGCVMARTANTGAAIGDDSNDTPPSTGHYFQPFLYLSTYHMYPTPAGITYGSGHNQGTWWYPGDNDWLSSNWTKAGNSAVAGDGKSGVSNEPDGGNEAVGPNLGCPSLPILPETASKTTVLATINKMVPISRGGTFINLGLQAGWWTISPNWQSLWSTPPDPKLGAMPLAYNTPHMKKVIVLMTDGNNEWYDWNCGVPGQVPPTSGCPWTTNPPSGVAKWTQNPPDADFTAYGRLLANVGSPKLPTSNPTTTLNSLMTGMCTTIKNNGITIYTILFNNADPNTATLFQNCATSPSYYTNAPTQADLQTAFQQIGSQLASLRLAQ